MWRAKTEIINGCEKLNIKYLMTNDADAINLKSKVFNKFTSSGKSSHRLFESMINDVSYRGSESLLLLRDYPYKMYSTINVRETMFFSSPHYKSFYVSMMNVHYLHFI